MATIDNYTIKVDVQGEEQVNKLKQGIEGLKGAILGFGFGAFVHGAMEMADAISDLSHATGLSIGNIVAFQQALALSGGESKNAGKAIATFFQSIDSAAQGTETAQKALERIGISFKDVGDLSEKELLDKAVSNLAKMEAGSERTAAGIALFGKAFRTIDPAALKEALNSGNFEKASAAIEAAAAHVDAMHESFNNLQIAALEALEPIIGKMGETGYSLEQAEKLIKIVGVAMAMYLGVKVATTIVSIVKAIQEMNIALKAQAAIQAALQALQGPKGWAILAGSAVAATAAIVALNKAMEDSTGVEAKPGETPSEPTKPAGPARKTQFYSDAELQARKIALTTAEQTTEQLRLQNLEAQKYQTTINSTIGLMEEEAAIVKMTAQLQQDADNKILDLNKQIEVEKSKGRGTNQGVIAELEKQKVEVQNNLEITTRLKTEELTRLNTLKQQRAEMSAMASYLTESMNLATKQEELNNQAAVIQGKMTAEQATHFNELARIETDYYNKKLSLEEQIANTTSEIDRQVLEKKLENLKTFEKQEIDMLTKRVEQEKALRQSSTAGSVAALESLARSADPFVVAQNRINTAFSDMSSAIDNFVETGKFSFTDFANSIIKDLIKIELKAAATKLFTTASGGGGLGSLLGFADGGEPPVGVPSIVGENGPELFIPKTAGTVVPNNKIGGTNNVTHNTYITNQISAIDSKSVAQLFAENRKTLLGSVKMAEKELPYKLA